jgi:hypothetical protein
MKTTKKHHRKPNYTKIDLTPPKKQKQKFDFFLSFPCFTPKNFSGHQDNSFRGSSRHCPGGLPLRGG